MTDAAPAEMGRGSGKLWPAQPVRRAVGQACRGGPAYESLSRAERVYHTTLDLKLWAPSITGSIGLSALSFRCPLGQHATLAKNRI
jgi:hypothetical protein